MIISFKQITNNLLSKQNRSNTKKGAIPGMLSLFIDIPIHPEQHVPAYRVYVRVFLKKLNR
jgi:hypothetical protein